MRDIILNFLELSIKIIPFQDPIYEFGSRQASGQEKLADLRHYFPGKKYIGADFQKGSGVNIILDLHSINLPSNSVPTILCFDTFEHVEYPRKAISEIYRILSPKGIFILSSVMNYGIHNHPHDYWRFTPEAFQSLLKPFLLSVVTSAGKPTFPHTVIGIAFKSSPPPSLITTLNAAVQDWTKKFTT